MPPFKAPRAGVPHVKPFGQGVDGIVGKVDKADHGKFGKPPMPKRRKSPYPNPNFRP